MPWTCRISLSASIVLPRSIGPSLVALALDCISPGNWCKHMGDASGPRVPRGRVAPSMSCCPWEKSPKLDFVPLLAERSEGSAQPEGPPCHPEHSEGSAQQVEQLCHPEGSEGSRCPSSQTF